MKQTSQTVPATEFNLRHFSFLIVYVLFFAVLNETVFSVSTPKISEQFQLQPSEVSWVITIFIITFGIGQVIFGKLGDMYDLRRLILIGIVIYNMASILGIILQSWYPLVIINRAIQGIGASAIPALVMVIVARYFTPAQRGKLFGLFTSTVSFAIAMGPVIGGYVSSYMHWSFLFLIPIFLLPTIPFFFKLLPKEEIKEKKGRIDILGAFLLAIAIATLVVFCTNPQWYFLLVCILAAIWFIVHIRRVENPFVDPKLFSIAPYRTGVMIGFILFGAVMGVMFMFPIMLNSIHQLTTDKIGTLMFPGAFSAVIFGTVAGNLTSKRGSHTVFYIGFSLIIFSLLMLSGLTDKWIWYTGATLISLYIGFSFVQTAMAETVTATLPKSQIGVGMGFYGLSSFIAGAIGTAVISKLLDSQFLTVAFLPFVDMAKAHIYSNLFLFFTALICITGILYVSGFNRKKEPLIPATSKGE